MVLTGTLAPILLRRRKAAVLEQRIGRVHRLGQRRGVQAVNFVAQASIEEGM